MTVISTGVNPNKTVNAEYMKSHKGFTLIEMVMVIIILGTLSAVVLPKLSLNTFEVEAVSGELIAAIRYAQEKSMSNTGAPDYQIAITVGGYLVTQNGVNIIHPVNGVAPYQSNWTNVTLAPPGVIAFDGYGVPTLSGALIFGGNQAVVTVTMNGGSDTVTLERVTGYTR